MILSSYKVNSKHRQSKPTQNASIWTVSEWYELFVFTMAGVKEWKSPTSNILWSLLKRNNKLEKLGIDTDGDLFFAKFKCDHNNEWHGYPVAPRDNDIPPDAVLEAWRRENLIDKTDKRRIQGGKF